MPRQLLDQITRQISSQMPIQKARPTGRPKPNQKQAKCLVKSQA